MIAPDVSDLVLDIRFRGRHQDVRPGVSHLNDTWDFELVSPEITARFCSVPCWDTYFDPDGIPVGYTEAFKTAEDCFIYQVTAQDWLRDDDGTAVSVLYQSSKGRVTRIDFEREEWSCETPKTLL